MAWYNDEKERTIAILTANCIRTDKEGNLELIYKVNGSNGYNSNFPAFQLIKVITGYTKRGCLHAHDYFTNFGNGRIAIAIFRNEPMGLNNDIDIDYSFHTNDDISKHIEGLDRLIVTEINDANNFGTDGFWLTFSQKDAVMDELRANGISLSASNE